MPGPIPGPHSRKRGVSHTIWLPSEGNTERTPDWPLDGDPGPAARKIWAQAWSLPQSVIWSKQQTHRLIARWVLMLVECEQPGDVNAAKLAELRQLEDRLGLNPTAMARLRWQIGEPATVVPITEKPKRRLFATEEGGDDAAG